MRPSVFLLSCLMPSVIFAQSTLAPIESPRFSVYAYQLEGNTLIATDRLNEQLRPFIGENKQLSDVQEAIQTIEQAYRAQGYSSIRVFLPEQSSTNGQIRLKVVEGRIGKITFSGNQFHDEDNIRTALPALQEGQTPIIANISENIQLSNENASKYTEVLLNSGKEEGVIDADVRIHDASPYRLNASLDNTGSPETGQHRVNLSFAHNNLWNKDHALNLSYITVPQKKEGVRIGVYSLAYRIPLYRLSSSLDFLYAHSSADMSAQALAGGLGINGKGDVYSFRWNWLLPRDGEYTSRVSLIQDKRDMKSACLFENGMSLHDVAGCKDYAVLPFSLTYQGKLENLKRTLVFTAGAVYNLGGSDKETYRLASGDRAAPVHYKLLRASFFLNESLPKDWIFRMNAQAQHTNSPLVLSEQIGLAGASAVRGFSERAVAADRGFFIQNELHTPNLNIFSNALGSLRALLFLDYAQGRNPDLLGSETPSILSAGLGLRYNLAQNVSWQFDLANILKSHPEISGHSMIDDKWRVHFSLSAGF